MRDAIKYMTNRFVLNLNQQPNDDYEVHESGCENFPVTNFDELGNFYGCLAAGIEARRRYPDRKINGCKVCAYLCHKR